MKAYRIRPLHLGAVLLLVCMLVISVFQVSPARGAQPVVHAILFYSPTCGHCHKVMSDVLPPLAKKYGDQLVILEVNVREPEGSALHDEAVAQYQVPSTGVPLLVIGDTYLLGSLDIPQQLPGIIAGGLKEGGIAWPNLTGLSSFVDTTAAVTLPAVSSPAGDVQGVDSVQEPEDERPVWVQRFQNDLAGNTIAVIVLAGMLASVGIIGFTYVQTTDFRDLKRGPLSITWPHWVVPALCLAGFFVAGYLSYVEITHTQAVCGPVGDCNTVQQSPYATLWGFLPVGVFGLIGYAAILGAWALYRFGPAGVKNLSAVAVWGMALIGTLFSIYLTFLEPFVIGATCAWCIANAILVTLLLWVTTRPALAVLSSGDLDDWDDGTDRDAASLHRAASNSQAKNRTRK